MDTGKAAVAVTGAYLLGRFGKARWALALAGAAAGRQLRSKDKGGAAGLLKSAEVGKLTEGLRGQLTAVGKAAATAATARQIDAISDRLAGRTEALRAGSGGSSDASDEDEASAEDEGADEPEDEPEDEEQQEPRGGGKRAGAGKSGTPSRGTAAKKTTAAKKQAAGRTTGKKASSTRPSAAKKKAASTAEKGKRTARKSTGSGSARGGRSKE